MCKIIAAVIVLVRLGTANGAELGDGFLGGVRPFLERYCFECHDAKTHKGKLDLTQYREGTQVTRDAEQWKLVLTALDSAEMPPDEAKSQPAREERAAMVLWLRDLLTVEAARNAGDPGAVHARRLSSAEYDHTIRDLTGVDLRPTREFPVDPANESGFDNSSESLVMSPGLLKKYLDAARMVADHLVIKPDGLAFAPHPVVTEPDHDRYCVNRIVEFYRRHEPDLAEYFEAAWHVCGDNLPFGRGEQIERVAKQRRLSPKYLRLILQALTEPGEATGPLQRLRIQWRSLPQPGTSPMDEVRRKIVVMRDFVLRERARFRPDFPNLEVSGISEGSQPLVLWKNRQYAAHRMRPGTPPPVGEAEQGTERDLARFCAVFPDAFFVSERGRVFLKESEQNKGRLLSAGFHLMVGYFRDDAPLCELILSDSERGELDALWAGLDSIARAPIRQYKDFIFFERAEPPRFMEGAEFDFARSEDKSVTSEAMMRRLAAVYLEKARKRSGDKRGFEAISDYFDLMSNAIRRVERGWIEAQPGHLTSLLEFARRAYRRPLRNAEAEDLLAFYRSMRRSHGLDHEAAVRESVVSILMSPSFCFRMDLAGEPID